MIPNIHSLTRYCERHSWGREFVFFHTTSLYHLCKQFIKSKNPRSKIQDPRCQTPNARLLGVTGKHLAAGWQLLAMPILHHIVHVSYQRVISICVPSFTNGLGMGELIPEDLEVSAAFLPLSCPLGKRRLLLRAPVIRLSLGKLLVNLLQVVKRTSTPLIMP